MSEKKPAALFISTDGKMRGAKAAKARAVTTPDAPTREGGPARAPTADKLTTRLREELGDEWPGRIYLDRIMTLRTRSHQLPLPAARAQVEILHTLLGVELKVGRRRISCPDLATARYLRVFARAGLREVAVPYDITKISRLADELESAWHRMMLLADHLSEGKGERARARARSAVIREFRAEVERIGAGAAMPQFNQNTRQRPSSIKTDD